MYAKYDVYILVQLPISGHIFLDPTHPWLVDSFYFEIPTVVTPAPDW